jgi:hypothetical protein
MSNGFSSSSLLSRRSVADFAPMLQEGGEVTFHGDVSGVVFISESSSHLLHSGFEKPLEAVPNGRVHADESVDTDADPGSDVAVQFVVSRPFCS